MELNNGERAFLFSKKIFKLITNLQGIDDRRSFDWESLFLVIMIWLESAFRVTMIWVIFSKISPSNHVYT